MTSLRDLSRSRARLDFTFVALALPPLLWAGNIAVGRAVNRQAPPATLAFARQIVAFVALLPFAWPAMRRDIRLYWGLRWQLLKLSLSGFVAFNALVYLGLRDTSASNAQLLNSSIPVLIILFGTLLDEGRLGFKQATGLALSCAGVALIIFKGDPSRALALKFSRGDLIVLAGMASFALFSVWLRAVPRSIDRLGFLGAQLLVAAIILAPLAAVEHLLGFHTRLDPGGAVAVVYIGIAAGLLANLVYMAGVQRIGSVRAGLYIHLVPLYGVLLSVSLLGEAIHAFQFIGMAAILGGLVLSQRYGGSSPPGIGVTPGAPDG